MHLKLLKVMKEELKLLKTLLFFLENQYNLLIMAEKDIVKISQTAEDIDEVVRNIASLEMQKKNILQGKSLLKEIEISNDKEMKDVYHETLNVLDKVAIQKDANYLFVKQQLFFTKSIIKAITPKRNAEIYDSFGKIRK